MNGCFMGPPVNGRSSDKCVVVFDDNNFKSTRIYKPRGGTGLSVDWMGMGRRGQFDSQQQLFGSIASHLVVKFAIGGLGALERILAAGREVMVT